jgi:hypothetical protein
MLSGFEQLPLSCEQFYISFYVFAFHVRHRPLNISACIITRPATATAGTRDAIYNIFYQALILKIKR